MASVEQFKTKMMEQMQEDEEDENASMHLMESMSSKTGSDIDSSMNKSCSRTMSRGARCSSVTGTASVVSICDFIEGSSVHDNLLKLKQNDFPDVSIHCELCIRQIRSAIELHTAS